MEDNIHDIYEQLKRIKLSLCLITLYMSNGLLFNRQSFKSLVYMDIITSKNCPEIPNKH